MTAYAAIYHSDNGTDVMCFAYGDTLPACQQAARVQLQVPHNTMGNRLYRKITWTPLTDDMASEVSAMLSADWIL